MKPTWTAVMLVAALTQVTACCENAVVAKVASPDGRRVAVNYLRYCGPTTLSIGRVAIVPVGARPVSGRWDVFSAEDTITAPVPFDTMVTRVRMAWRAPDTLEITYDPRAAIDLHPTASHVVVIRRVRPAHQ